MRFDMLFLLVLGALTWSPVAGGASSRATVLGKEIVARDADALRSTVEASLLSAHAAAHMIDATDAEIEQLLRYRHRMAGMDAARMRRDAQGSAESPGARDDDVLLVHDDFDLFSVDELSRIEASRDILRWKLNRDLFAYYGGRVAVDDGRAVPVDAFRDFMMDRRQAGDFRIYDRADEARFWRFYSSDEEHEYVAGPMGETIIARPPWGDAITGLNEEDAGASVITGLAGDEDEFAIMGNGGDEYDLYDDDDEKEDEEDDVVEDEMSSDMDDDEEESSDF